MESSRTVGKGAVTGIIVALVVVLGLAVGAVAYLANHTRTDQLHSDEVGRQRDDAVNAAHAGAPAAAAATGMTSAHGPSTTQPAGR